MKKRFISMALAVLLAASALTGCGSDTASTTESGDQTAEQTSGTGEKVVIAWLGVQDEDVIDPLTGVVTPGKAKLEEMLTEKSGYDVDIVSIMGGNWIQQTETLVQSGEVDIVRYTNQTQIPTWCDDLTPYIENDEELSDTWMEDTFIDFAQHYMKYTSFDYPDEYGKIFGLPISMTGEVFVYDSLLFEQWGVEPPEPGASFQELLEIGKKMTGINPVTGEQNYGLYVQSSRAEFDAISFDALKPISMDSADITEFDRATYVDALKDSPELLEYFQWLEEAVAISPPGVASNSGNELWLSENNNIAINITTTECRNLFNIYYRAGLTDTTDRFKWFNLPLSSDGMMGFPELQFMGIAHNSEVKDAAWDVLKIIATDPEVVDYFMLNYSYVFLPVLKDTSNLTFMTENPTAQARYDFNCEHSFITDDYWHFRTPITPIISKVIAQEITPEEARQQTYEEVAKWVDKMETLNTAG